MNPRLLRQASWMALSATLLAPAPAAAQVLDRVEIVPTASAAEIHLFFNTPVVYQSHFPPKRGDLVRVDLVLPELDRFESLRRERLTSPPSDLVPPFSVSFPDQNVNGVRSLSINFNKPVDFNVQSAKTRNSIVISVPVRSRKPAPQPAPRAARPKRSHSPAPATVPEKGTTSKDRLESPRSGTAREDRGAEVLGRIEVVPRKSTAEIHIHFKTPVGYMYHFPRQPGDFVRVWLVAPEAGRLGPLKRQTSASPPSDLVPGFTVTFPEKDDTRTKSLTVRFTEPVEFKVRGSKGSREIIVAVPLKTPLPGRSVLPQPPKAPGSPLQGQGVPSGSDVQHTADDLMASGRAALNAGQNQKATELFNALLNLPPNRHSQDAQELVGLARERSGEIVKARVEYELYLKLYPEGPGTARVRQRLAALGRAKAGGKGRKARRKREAKRGMTSSVFGTFSQYYYGGLSQRRLTTTSGILQATSSENLQDQSLLVSTLNVTGRTRTSRHDNRLVFRGTNHLDMLEQARKKSELRIRSAYLKHEHLNRLYTIQIGRQPGPFGGVLTSFDGGWLRYGLLPEFGVNAVGGLPQESTLEFDPDLDLSRYFYGASLDFGPFFGNLTGDTYFISELVDGIGNRQAAGGELRYASGGLSAFSHIDYDLSYHVINIAMLNASWRASTGTTLTMLLDHRKTPSMRTTNGLLASGAPSVKDALRTLSEEELRRQARALTTESDLLQVGLIHPITDRWQLGGDVSLNRTLGTDAAGSQPALPGTGNIWTYTARAIGSNVLFRNHTLTINASHIDNPGFEGQSLSINSLARFGEAWRLDTLVTLHHQQANNDVRLVRVTPTLRLGYRLNNHMTLEVEGGVERADIRGLNQQDEILREFFFFGYILER